LTGRYPAIASAVDALAPSLSETHALKYWCCPHPVPQALRLGGSVEAPLQLAADDHLAGSINSVNLEDRLRNVETDCRGRLHG
jgi:hypothetical protein